ncbi:MAG: MATE family efflux transporter, partial [Muribaculaceae bacterium]|nr:MATE family efflux transporter [Muribaculaceae bacterium]
MDSDIKRINHDILAIALPAIVSNITTPLLGLVDVAIVGHIGSAAYIGAIAVGSTMFNMLYWMFAFLRMGTAGLTSQSCGAADFRASSAHLRRALFISTCIAVLLIIFSKPLGQAALYFLDADEATAPLADRYFSIAIFGAPAVLGTYVMNGWLLGMQNTRIPMFVAIATNIFNIAVSATLVFGVGLRIEGVAIGTASAQWAGFITLVIAVWRRYRPVQLSFAEIVSRDRLATLFKINFDIFIRTLCLVVVTAWFTRAGAGQGVEILAANALLMQLFMFYSYFTDGFAFAGEALAGKHYGAGQHTLLRAVVRRLLWWGMWLAVGFSCIYLVG